MADETPKLITTHRGYTRTVKPRLVTWSCQWCGAEHTEYRYPGPAPRYCDECRQPAQNAQARETMQRRRHPDQAPTCPTCTRLMVREQAGSPWYCWHCQPQAK